MTRSAMAVLALICLNSAALAQNPDIQKGSAFARANCARCHAIDKTTQSPLAAAPPFRDLHKSYPVETLEEALAEGIITGHPAMPEFRLDPAQIRDFIGFLKTLE